jgi:hypothetical protein
MRLLLEILFLEIFVLWWGGEVVSSFVFSRFLWKWVAVQSGFNALLFVVVAA